MTTATLRPPAAHDFGAPNGGVQGKQTLGLRVTRSMQGLRTRSRESAENELAKSSLRTRSNSSGTSARPTVTASTAPSQTPRSTPRPAKSGSFSSFLRKLTGRASSSSKAKGDKTLGQKTQAQQQALANAGLIKAPISKTTAASAGAVGAVTTGAAGAGLLVEKIASQNGSPINEKPPASPITETVAQPSSPVKEKEVVQAEVNSVSADHSTVESSTHAQSGQSVEEAVEEAPATTLASVEETTRSTQEQVPAEATESRTEAETETSAQTQAETPAPTDTIITSTEPSAVDQLASNESAPADKTIEASSHTQQAGVPASIAGIPLGAPIAASGAIGGAEQQPTDIDPHETPMDITSRNAASEPIDKSVHVDEHGVPSAEKVVEPVEATTEVVATAPSEVIESTVVEAADDAPTDLVTAEPVTEETKETPVEAVAETNAVADASVAKEETAPAASEAPVEAATATSPSNNWPVQFASDPEDADDAYAAIQPVEDVEAAETVQPVETAKTVDAVQPVETVNTVEPVHAVDAAKSVEPAEPVGAVETTPVELVEPIPATPPTETSALPTDATAQSPGSTKDEQFNTPSEEIADPFDDQHSPVKSSSPIKSSLSAAEKEPVAVAAAADDIPDIPDIPAVDSSASRQEVPAVVDLTDDEPTPAAPRGIKLAPIVTSNGLPAGAAAPIVSPLSSTARSVSNRSNKIEMHSLEGFDIEESEDVVSELGSGPRSAIATSPTDTIFSGSSRNTSPVVSTRGELPRQDSTASTATNGSLGGDLKKGSKWRRSMMGLSDALGGKSVSRKSSTKTLPTPTELAPPLPRIATQPQRYHPTAERRTSPTTAARVSCQPTLHTNKTIGAGLKNMDDGEDFENFFLA